MADGKKNLTQWTTPITLVTGQWFWLGIGVAIGVILGIALNAAQGSGKPAPGEDRDPA